MEKHERMAYIFLWARGYRIRKFVYTMYLFIETALYPSGSSPPYLECRYQAEGFMSGGRRIGARVCRKQSVAKLWMWPGCTGKPGRV